jgi:polyphenol oxidase
VSGAVVSEVKLAGARVLFSTRKGGVSEGPYESLNLGILTDDLPERIAENRKRLAEAAGLEPGGIAMGWQVHGSEVKRWEGPPAPGEDGYATPGAELSRVDGHVTTRPGVGLLVLVADCLPLALVGAGQVAMLHCGWRGLAGGLVERALAEFEEPPEALVGPGIGPCCYEVGQEVLAAFEDLDGVANGRMLDLRAVAERKLEAGGVRAIQHVEDCTSCNGELYFSHRRDGGVTGRQAGVVVLDG